PAKRSKKGRSGTALPRMLKRASRTICGMGRSPAPTVHISLRPRKEPATIRSWMRIAAFYHKAAPRPSTAQATVSPIVPGQSHQILGVFGRLGLAAQAKTRGSERPVPENRQKPHIFDAIALPIVLGG